MLFFYFPPEPTNTLRCVCNDTQNAVAVPCIEENFSCESTTMCYVHRFWSMAQGRAFSEWGCLDKVIDPLLRSVCTINDTVRGNIYFCCNNTDFCNNVTLRLPREMSVTTPVSPPSASPSAFTTGENGRDRIWENREKGRGTGRIEGFGGPN